MNLPNKASLPLKAKENLFLIDQTKIDEFHRAFKDSKSYTPPTLMAVSMKGIFDLLNDFKIDWRKLLHASQSFTYVEKFTIPANITAQTILMDIKSRASMYWFQFETEVRDKKSNKLMVTCKSLLMTAETL